MDFYMEGRSFSPHLEEKLLLNFTMVSFCLFKGRLNGWAITLFSDKLVVCAVYYDNKIDGEKIIFDANEQMWVGSLYS